MERGRSTPVPMSPDSISQVVTSRKRFRLIAFEGDSYVTCCTCTLSPYAVIFLNMSSKIIEMLKEEERISFLKLSPVERILRMESLLYEVIAIRAADEGVPESEIYNRYLERDKKRRRCI